MRLIDADALIAQMEAETEYIKEPIMAMFVYAAISDVKHAPTIEPEPHWRECIEGDPASFPNDSRNVLVSFSNFSLSIIGQWRTDEDGRGCWYLGDTDETFIENDLYVDGWWELPKKPMKETT